MPMDRSLYPPNCFEIALKVKESTGWECQQCGRPCRRPGQDWEDFAEWAKLAKWKVEEEESHDLLGHHFVIKKAKWILLVANLNHDPEDWRPENLKALCSGCYWRHVKSQGPLKKQLKREKEGQIKLI